MTQLLNEQAAALFPDHYGSGSDFALQITSDIVGSQSRTINFSNNNLNGWTKYNAELEGYESSKTRVCVTVGMMTTGYDCPDLLNVVLARPIFSPTDYIQIKGRGTRLHTFEFNDGVTKIDRTKDNFYIFDFFANHQYFEDEYDYDQIIPLIETPEGGSGGGGGGGGGGRGAYTWTGVDDIAKVQEEQFDQYRMMRVDLEAFSKSFESHAMEAIRNTPELWEAVAAEDWQTLSAYIRANVFDRPAEYWNLNKLQDAYDVDRRVSLPEILQKIFMGQPLKTRSDLVEENFQQFLGSVNFDGSKYNEAKQLFSSYLLFDDIRQMFNENQVGRLATDMRISINDLKNLGKENRETILNYIKDHVSINRFLPK